MNFDIPYERFNNKNKVEYIPLKLALNDENTDNEKGDQHSSSPSLSSTSLFNNGELQNQQMNVGDHQYNYFEKRMVDILMLSLLTFFCVLVLLYAVYYFVILRDRQDTLMSVQPNFF
ncbi:hypothetical protein [Perigonia lusca single nucleopolyhedrovirus]|uniref:Ac78-like protein n=1 Tax=Perigonia lusca single nucleopolyhedrovirus TaxID=1675865 RepID=A0A0M3WNH0_9ABAC|nr:hypothetical protein [Perigonia lusca single nucleopolyhedrovirus]AKN80652.1 hypothetical protein [Perigonia lusca single nucleopolyhedrovirus]